jgi:hypothetical protein
MTMDELAARLEMHYALQLLQLEMVMAQIEDWYNSRPDEVETLQTYLRNFRSPERVAKHESQTQP